MKNLKLKKSKNILFAFFVLLFINNNAFTQNWAGQGQGLLWKKIHGTNNIIKNPTIGNVGIGVQNPVEKIDLLGNIKIRGDVIEEETYINNNTGINNNFTIYPNPAQNYLFVKSTNSNNKEVKIFIYNILGNLVLKKTLLGIFNNPYKIDLSYLNKGVYFIKVQTNSFFLVNKLIII
jgi:hypothetical protein